MWAYLASEVLSDSEMINEHQKEHWLSNSSSLSIIILFLYCLSCMESLVLRTIELRWLWCQWSVSCLFSSTFCLKITDPLLSSYEQCIHTNTVLWRVFNEVYFIIKVEDCNGPASQDPDKQFGLWRQDGWKFRVLYTYYTYLCMLEYVWQAGIRT